MIVVARDRQELLSYFERIFEGMPEIRVQVDRRYAPPGTTSAPDHQVRRDVYDELQQRGFVMIRLW
jgi:hypothetical protein